MKLGVPKPQNRWWVGQSSGKETGCVQEERTDALATDFWEYQQGTLLEAEGQTQTQNPLLIAATKWCPDRMLHWIGFHSKEGAK